MTKVTFKDGTKIVMNTKSGFLAVKEACRILNQKLENVTVTKLLPVH